MKESSIHLRDPWPIWLWCFLLFLAASLSLAVEAALGNRFAWITFLTQLLLLAWASLRTPLDISLDDHQLRVGSATIERRFLKEVVALSANEMALTRGRNIDPRSWMALRFWVSTGVKIVIADPQDPTPYWLVSTKKATALAAALNDLKDKN